MGSGRHVKRNTFEVAEILFVGETGGLYGVEANQGEKKAGADGGLRIVRCCSSLGEKVIDEQAVRLGCLLRARGADCRLGWTSKDIAVDARAAACKSSLECRGAGVLVTERGCVSIVLVPGHRRRTICSVDRRRRGCLRPGTVPRTWDSAQCFR